MYSKSTPSTNLQTSVSVCTGVGGGVGGDITIAYSSSITLIFNGVDKEALYLDKNKKCGGEGNCGWVICYRVSTILFSDPYKHNS